MDREDVVFASSIILVGAGIGLFHVGAGMASAGGMLFLSFLISMTRGTPPKKEEQ